MTIQTSFDIFGTITFSWEFFRHHTGRGIPRTEWRGGLICRTHQNPEVFSIVPWLYMLPEKYRADILKYMADWCMAHVLEDIWRDPDEDKFKYEAYGGFVELIQQKMLANEWPIGGS